MAKKEAKKLNLVKACKSFFNQPNLVATNKIIAAARSYRRQLRKVGKKTNSKKAAKKSRKAA